MFKNNKCLDPIDIHEAADILGKTITSVYKYIRHGKLTKFKQLNRSVVSRAEVEKLLEPIRSK